MIIKAIDVSLTNSSLLIQELVPRYFWHHDSDENHENIVNEIKPPIEYPNEHHQVK